MYFENLIPQDLGIKGIQKRKPLPLSPLLNSGGVEEEAISKTYVYLGLRLAKAVFGALAFLCAKVKIPNATNERNEADAKPNAFFADVV